MLYDYTFPSNRSNPEFSVKKGEFVQVIRKPQSGWVGVAKLGTKKAGYVPESYGTIVLPSGDPEDLSSKSKKVDPRRIHVSLTSKDLLDMRISPLTQSSAPYVHSPDKLLEPRASNNKAVYVTLLGSDPVENPSNKGKTTTHLVCPVCLCWWL